MPWYEEFNSVFFTGLGTMLFGFLALLIRYAFLSKCDNVSLCGGLVQIHRAVELEDEVEEENKNEEKQSI